MDAFEGKSRLLFGCLLALFLLSLIPIVWIAFYSYPSADDFSYAAAAALAWEETHSFSAVLSCAWQNMIASYKSWNGLFSAIFFASIQPMVFGMSLYPIGVLVLFFSCLCSLGFLLYSLSRCVFGCTRISSAIISLILTFLACQYIYDPVESFFWFTGGVHYTFSHSLAFLVLSILLHLITASGKRTLTIGAVLFCIPLAIYIGGGNYSTGLTFILVLFSLIAFLLWSKKRHSAALVAVVLVALCASFLVSFTAPGAALRQETVGPANSPLKAILLSFIYGGYALSDNTTLPAILAWILITPILYRAASRSSFSFPAPLLLIVYIFGVFCSQGTPVFYAIGINMPERVINIIYLSYYPLFLFCWWYFLGWLSHQRQWRVYLESIFAQLPKLPRYFVHAVIIFSLMVSMLGLVQIEKDPQSGNISFKGLPFSVEAAYLVLTGEAPDYYAQLKARESTYRSFPNEDVAVSPLRQHPYLLFQEDISEDPDYWVNDVLASFFGVNSVRLTSASR